MCKTSVSYSVGYSKKKNTHLPIHLFWIVFFFFLLFFIPCTSLTVAENLQINKGVNSPIKADCSPPPAKIVFVKKIKNPSVLQKTKVSLGENKT